MATTKKASGGRRKKTTTAANTKKFAGKVYTKASCHTRKTDAKAAAEKLRAGGKSARVVKVGTANCVFARSGR